MINPYTKDNPGNFANDPEKARRAGKKSGGKFQPGSDQARKAGKKGGAATAARYLDEARRKNAR